jgi:excisionase family DNA binding protein
MQTQLVVHATLEQLIEALRPVIRHELTHAQLLSSAEAVASADELLTVQQAAQLLDVCVATVFEWKRRGLIVSTKIGGRTYLKRADLLAAGSREQRTVKPARTKCKPPN